MAYILSSHMVARSVPSRTAHHHLEAGAHTVPGSVNPRTLRVRIAVAILAFAPFARGRGGSVESTGSLSGGAAVEERTGELLALGVRAVAWVVHVLGLAVLRVSEDPHELPCLRVPVEVEEDRDAPGIGVDALVNVGAIGAARPAKQSMHMRSARAVSQQQQQRAYGEGVSFNYVCVSMCVSMLRAGSGALNDDGSQ
eukprot:COSAG05_NODE_857_length_6940_cov_4.243385_8_plen_197_part_00